MEVVTSGDTVQLRPHRALRELVVWSPLPVATLKTGVPTDSAAPHALQELLSCNRTLVPHGPWKTTESGQFSPTPASFPEALQADDSAN